MSNPLFVGIDIGSKKNYACFLNSSGDRVTHSLPFDNNLPGAQSILSSILSLAKTHSFDSISIGLEATSVYNSHLVNFFFFSQDLSPFNPQIYVINPKLIKGFKKSYPDLPKTDDIDAFVITDRLRFGRLPASAKVDLPYLSLRKLTRARFHLVQNLSREKCFFLTNLFIKFSTYAQYKPFSDTFGATSTSIITSFSTEDLVSMSLEQLISFIIQKGKNRFQNPNLIAQELKKIAADSYRLSSKMKESIDIVLSSILENITTTQAQIKRIDKAILKELAGIKHTLLSVPGIGPVSAAGIIAEIGNISSFKNQAALAKFAGLVWNKHQSGNFQAEETHISKSGNRYLRYFLVEAANCLRLHNPVFNDFYSRKYQKSNKHHHKRALILCARKLVRLIYSLLQSKKLYESPKKSS
ncbi:MAG: IS110 family transposase [Nitrospirota bacterium]